MLLLDVDHLAKINDAHGHPVGNEVLKALTNILRSIVRCVDYVFRYGGDEFAMLLPNTDLKGGLEVRQRLLYVVEDSVVLSQIALTEKVTVTIVACQHNFGHAESSLISRAEQALLRAKRGGDDDEAGVAVPV
jgi:diguanylate cyclase